MNKRRAFHPLLIVNSGAIVLFVAAILSLFWQRSPALIDGRVPAAISHP